jgi:outer membrane protein OmpA-like peptidoglycan-associated protein
MDKWPEQSDHVIIRGLGSRQPVAGNGTEEGRARNRRVVILIKRQEGRTVADLLTDTATRAGDSLILKDVNFYPGRHTPLPTSLPVLDQLATAMNANPRLSIGIDGYVCCTDAMGDGLDLDNGQQDLSAQRAKYVYDYLIGRGIAPERLRYTGHGGQNKLYPAEVNEAQQSANRRVVIRILEK